MAAKTLLASPQVRAYAKQGARTVGLAALRAVNRRRERRGRRVLFRAPPRQAPRPTGVSRETRTAVPVRVNTVDTRATTSEIVRQSEQTNIVLAGQMYDDHEAVGFRVDPTQNVLWPSLAQKAPLFSKYDFVSLQFEYIPIQGTDYGGQLAMGFTPQAQKEGTDYNSSSEVLAMPVSVQGTVNSRMVLTVPLNRMSQGGKGLFMPTGSVQVSEPTLYFAGTLAILPFQCDDNGANLGVIKATYNVVLKEKQLDTGPTGGLLVPGSLIRPGHVNLTPVSLGSDHKSVSFTYCGMRNMALLLRSAGTTGDITVTINGAPLTQTVGGAVSTGHYFQVFYIGRKVGVQTISIVEAGDWVIERLCMVDMPNAFLA